MVTPLRVTEFAGCLYLAAMCHLSQEERTFRWDRIVEISWVGGMRAVAGGAPARQ